MKAEDVQKELDRLANPQNAERAQRFFKTYDGGYAAGDKFIGLTVPTVRLVTKKYKGLPLEQIEKLLESPIHEHRSAAVIIMTEQAKKAGQADKKRLYDLYLRRSDRINNWDLVDISCREVVGEYLMDRPRDILYKLARSKNIWERRIAIVSTWQFIRAHQFKDTFQISEILIDDTEDLIHKAVGWMLREAGKRDRAPLLKFLDQHAAVMPRTALRYSIEHLPPAQKQHYMALKNSVK